MYQEERCWPNVSKVSVPHRWAQYIPVGARCPVCKRGRETRSRSYARDSRASHQAPAIKASVPSCQQPAEDQAFNAWTWGTVRSKQWHHGTISPPELHSVTQILPHRGTSCVSWPSIPSSSSPPSIPDTSPPSENLMMVAVVRFY